MNRTALINSLITKIGAKSYLEIGVYDGNNLDQVICQRKTGVDPVKSDWKNPEIVLVMNSDEFFRQNEEMFDIIFIDGLHHADQVERDIKNALMCLNPNGYIICHDMNPMSEQAQAIPYKGGMWNGDCWKAFVKLRRSSEELISVVVDTDEGCGIICKGDNKAFRLTSTDSLTYENLAKNRREWLNLISVHEFYTQVIGSDIHALLRGYITDTASPHTNFYLGFYYDSIGQTASAISYYIRAAERASDDVFAYEGLIRASMCFSKQGTRGLSVRGLLQRAMVLLPRRPEAYYLLSRFYENESNVEGWVNCFTIASLGEQICDFNSPPLLIQTDYPGKYGIIFERAVSSWWVGLCGESKNTFLHLIRDHNLDLTHRGAVLNNLKFLNQLQTDVIVSYDKTKFDRLKFKFSGSQIVEKNFSESYQDIFVLTMLNGKRNGTYVEVGSGKPFYGSNTALLEQSFDWNGISLEIDDGFVKDFSSERRNPCVKEDGTTVNYEDLFTVHGLPTNIDYLQIDCEPLDVSYKALLNIPFNKRKFAVVTFEHDAYCDTTRTVMVESRKYLESHGYRMVAKNIAPDDWRYYEDWYVHPDLVDIKMIELMESLGDHVKAAEDYMLNPVGSATNFEWGEISKNEEFLKIVNRENFIENTYQKFFNVEEGDVVVDVGASVGPFSYMAASNKPEKIYCFEPHSELFKTLERNMGNVTVPVKCIPKGIGAVDGPIEFSGLFNKDSMAMYSKKKFAGSIKFTTFLANHSIDRIDFLKTDCEGGEYDIFNEKNYEWIKKNVKKIAGEFHLHTEADKKKFRLFRDLYLKTLINHYVFSLDNIDIKWDLWNDHFIKYYSTVVIYIDNR